MHNEIANCVCFLLNFSGLESDFPELDPLSCSRRARAGGRKSGRRSSRPRAAAPLDIISQLVDKRQHTHFKTADDAQAKLAGRQMPLIKRISVDKALEPAW